MPPRNFISNHTHTMFIQTDEAFGTAMNLYRSMKALREMESEVPDNEGKLTEALYCVTDAFSSFVTSIADGISVSAESTEYGICISISGCRCLYVEDGQVDIRESAIRCVLLEIFPILGSSESSNLIRFCEKYVKPELEKYGRSISKSDAQVAVSWIWDFIFVLIFRVITGEGFFESLQKIKNLHTDLDIRIPGW